MDILAFLADVRTNVADNRFNDGEYLAAKYVVWLADKFASKYDAQTGWVPTHPLDFLSVAIVRDDPHDIEYRYTIVCNGGPDVFCDDLSGMGPIPLAAAIAGEGASISRKAHA